MDAYQEARLKAKKSVQLADHMAFMTYKVVKDPKLLVAILENVFLALTNSMTSLLHYERMFKRIPPFPENFESKFIIFKENCVKKYSIDKQSLSLMREVKDILYEHKASPVEFTRNDQFVICSDNYKMKTISLNKIKDYVSRAKLFVAEIDSIFFKIEGER